MALTRRALKGSRLTSDEYDANLDSLERLSAVILTISGGIINLNGGGPGVYRIETEGAATTDDVTGIIGGLGREWTIRLILNTPGRTVNFIHTPPNFKLRGSANFTLNDPDESIEFADRTSVIWREVGGRVGL